MDTPQEDAPTQAAALPPARPGKRRFALVGLTALMVGFLAAGAVGAANAQDGPPEATESEAPAPEGEADVDEPELSAEDEAVFEQYDKCLVDAGVDESVWDDESPLSQEQEQALDAAFESCDPILDGLSEQAKAEFEGDCDLEDDATDPEESDTEDTESDTEDTESDDGQDS